MSARCLVRDATHFRHLRFKVVEFLLSGCHCCRDLLSAVLARLSGFVLTSFMLMSLQFLGATKGVQQVAKLRLGLETLDVSGI